ncbi:MAG: hypothetical protein ACYCV5_06655 [Acidimicrobiales bacterium]|jgi:hypothetical protein
MIDVLSIVLGVLMVASLATILAYVVIFLSVTAWTVLRHRGSRRDPPADELDVFLAELWALDSGRLPGGPRHVRRFS